MGTRVSARGKRAHAVLAGVAATLVVTAIVVGVRTLWGSDRAPGIGPDRDGSMHGRIAFRDGSDIVTIDPANPTDRRVFGDAIGADPIDWTRDGSRMLLYRIVTDTTAGFRGHLYIVNANGRPNEIASDTDLGFGGSLSPDGSSVVYALMHRGLYVVSANGGAPRLLAAAEPQRYRWLESPAWSPDGSRIAFAEEFSDGLFALWVVTTDGMQRRITDLGSCEGGGCVWGMRWSPDGSRLAFLSQHREDIGIYVVQADGSGLHPVVRGSRHSFGRPSVAWSPDGTRIAFTRDGALFIAAADGRDEPLRLEGIRSSEIAWAPIR